MADDMELPAESRRMLIRCFERFDKSGNGTLERKELPEALMFAGIYCDPKQAGEIAELFDKNKDGKLQIIELVDNWQALSQHSVNGAELLEAFKTIDKNKDGYIRTSELKAVLTRAGEHWELNEAEECIRQLMKYDKDGDGKFDYPEFVAMFTANMYPFKKPEKVEKKDITQDYEKVKDDDDEVDGPPPPVASKTEEAEAEAKEEATTEGSGEEKKETAES